VVFSHHIAIVLGVPHKHVGRLPLALCLCMSHLIISSIQVQAGLRLMWAEMRLTTVAGKAACLLRTPALMEMSISKHLVALVAPVRDSAVPLTFKAW
jgi:hypothetical protein